ncbi:MAG: prepilin-type N-terminal cleavage/methylation domain-containing protein [Deltaproteobacteria bacterium]|nr:prepilin-type N-terminal cleavage/methylation domain-containing protein [Deltaproteobacteria bacterium]
MKTQKYILMRTAVEGNQRGFTLIEVLIAMAIFAIGILSLAGLQVTYIGGNASAQMQTEATALGAQVIENLKSLPFDAPELDPAVSPHQLPAGSIGPYDVRWIVADNTPVNNAKTINVTVTPANRVNGRRINISTIIAE